MSIPVGYDTINLYNSSISPSTVHCKNTALANQYMRYFYQRAISVLDFKLPDYWDKSYFYAVLFSRGYMGVVNTDRWGVIPQDCGLWGYNVFYQPTNIIVANPRIKGILQPKIGTECELIRLTPDYHGIFDIISYYADQMALAAESLAVNLQNTKNAVVFTASNKAMAESFKKMYDAISRGDPITVIDSSLQSADGSRNWDMMYNNLKEGYIVTDIINDMRQIESNFDTYIGIPNANYTKRERLVSDEVNANRIETFSTVALWLKYLKESFKKVNQLFGLDLDVTYAFREEVNGDGDPDADGAI